MAAVGDIYQIVDVSVLNGQECLNVFFYRRTAEVLVGNPAQQVADTYDASMLSAILPIQSGYVLHTEIRVQNLFDPSDQYTKVISEAGTWPVVDDNPFNAIGFRLQQDNGDIRNGAKRFAGTADDMSSQGVIDNTDLITALLVTGGALIAGLDIGIVADAIVPVIVKRILDGGHYRLPENSGEAVYGNVVGALYNTDITSQVSRKIGRGE